MCSVASGAKRGGVRRRLQLLIPKPRGGYIYIYIYIYIVLCI